jgi:hypothetical protein
MAENSETVRGRRRRGRRRRRRRRGKNHMTFLELSMP